MVVKFVVAEVFLFFCLPYKSVFQCVVCFAQREGLGHLIIAHGITEGLYKLFQIESSISIKLSVQQTSQLREAPF